MSSLKEIVSKLPQAKLFVFDLDNTLWPFKCDTHVTPPFKFDEKQLLDKHGFEINTYPDVYKVLSTLHNAGITIAAASRTHTTDIAQELINLLELNHFFTYKEIYSGTKLRHFEQFKKKSGIDYADMIFYDDEMRNIKEISRLGVTAQFLHDGLTEKDFINAIEMF